MRGTTSVISATEIAPARMMRGWPSEKSTIEELGPDFRAPLSKATAISHSLSWVLLSLSIGSLPAGDALATASGPDSFKSARTNLDLGT